MPRVQPWDNRFCVLFVPLTRTVCLQLILKCIQNTKPNYPQCYHAYHRPPVGLTATEPPQPSCSNLLLPLFVLLKSSPPLLSPSLPFSYRSPGVGVLRDVGGVQDGRRGRPLRRPEGPPRVLHTVPGAPGLRGVQASNPHRGSYPCNGHARTAPSWIAVSCVSSGLSSAPQVWVDEPT